jgi:WD40 repeat protein
VRLATSTTATWLIAIAGTGTAYAFHTSLGSPYDSIAVERNATMIMDAAGMRVALGGSRGRALLWQPGTPDAWTLAGMQGRVVDLRFSPDGSNVITITEDGLARTWDGARRTVIDSAPSAPLPVAAAFTGERGAVLAGDSLCFWSAGGGLRCQTGHAAPMSRLAVNIPGGLIATGAADGTVHLWTLTGERSARLPVHGSAIMDLALDSSGSRLLTRDELQRVRIFAVRPGEVRQIADSLLALASRR